MWMIAGLLVGSALITAVLGFHLGPHAHLLAGSLGVLAAVWLVFMLVDGRSAPVLWALLTANIVVSAGVGVLAWRALSTRGLAVEGHHLVSPVAAEGVALDDLNPSGIVRVQGENWSAVATNGTVRSGTPVRVLHVDGVRLAVWGEKTECELEADDSGQTLSGRPNSSLWVLSEVEHEGPLQ
jgi:membrane-bound ClpP family serine protease